MLGDSDGLVTLSSSVSIDHTEKFDCGAPVIALSVHPKQPLIAIATETDIIILVRNKLIDHHIDLIVNHNFLVPCWWQVSVRSFVTSH